MYNNYTINLAWKITKTDKGLYSMGSFFNAYEKVVEKQSRFKIQREGLFLTFQKSPCATLKRNTGSVLNRGKYSKLYKTANYYWLDERTVRQFYRLF